MGYLSKAWKTVTSAPKKIIKNIKKPFSKITKGIARGIAKMGKAVMRGVAKIGKKLGPMGMIGLAIAMPYALQGLGGMIGTPALSGYHPATGWLGSDNIFLKAVGNIGNNIRTGYSTVTGKIASRWETITNSVGNTFKKFSGGKGNIWTRISDGAKQLYTKAKATVKKFTPKFKGAQTGSVQVYGDMGEVITMSAEEAQKRIIAGTLDASQLGGQTLGSVDAGWFTQGQTSAQISANDLVTETINSALQPQVNMLDKNALKYYNDLNKYEKSIGVYTNNENALNTVMNNSATTRTFPGVDTLATEPSGYTTNLGKTKDYNYVQGHPTEAGSYQFTGDNTYNSQLAKNTAAKAKKSSNLLKKSASSYLAKKSLLSQDVAQTVEPFYAMPTDMTLDTAGVSYGGTDIHGSWGGSLLEGVFDKDKQEKIMTMYRNMNIIGSQ